MQAGMDEHDRAALVQHCKQRIEARIAEEVFAVARKQRDAVELEHVERIRDLVERALGAPHRHRAERAEALGPARDELGRVVIAAPCQRLRARLATEPDAGLRQRREGNLDAVRIHHIERELRRPIRIFAERRASPRRVDRLAVERRDEVEVNVDPARWCHPCLRHYPHPLVLNFASAHASMRGTNAGGRPCPGWTPTASASTLSLPGTGRRSCCCTRWEARSTAGTASLPPWASAFARCATTSAVRGFRKRCANRSPPKSWSKTSKPCCKGAPSPRPIIWSRSPPPPCRR